MSWELLKRRWPDVLAVIILGISAWIYLYQPFRVQEVSSPAPALTATRLDGQPFDHASLKGRVVLVTFWATWCGYCKRELPDLEVLQQKYGDKGLTVLALSVDDSADKVKRFWTDKPYSFPVAMASEDVQRGFGGVEVLPTLFLVDREGMVKRQIKGSVSAMALESTVKDYL